MAVDLPRQRRAAVSPVEGVKIAGPQVGARLQKGDQFRFFMLAGFDIVGGSICKDNASARSANFLLLRDG
jgi:hypothetical protein